MNKLYISPTSTAIPVSVSTMLCGSTSMKSNDIQYGGKTQSGQEYTPRSARESQIWGKEDMW
ncbi:MAG: hypothetical protein MR624_03500 [Bacteroidales bacterium]|nr:hypothetical protein [Bacteroidales bacterium]MCI6252074.1 hypothetical protein [Bacteroidales bacterium]MDY5086634.1 hypothetical protein [Alloprevotella sp.]MDY6033467.1 hypothetical protein [Alloprevotella sp.]